MELRDKTIYLHNIYTYFNFEKKNFQSSGTMKTILLVAVLCGVSRTALSLNANGLPNAGLNAVCIQIFPLSLLFYVLFPSNNTNYISRQNK